VFETTYASTLLSHVFRFCEKNIKNVSESILVSRTPTTTGGDSDHSRRPGITGERASEQRTGVVDAGVSAPLFVTRVVVVETGSKFPAAAPVRPALGHNLDRPKAVAWPLCRGGVSGVV